MLFVQHAEFCALFCCENWPQRWLWIVMPTSASMITQMNTTTL